LSFCWFQSEVKSESERFCLSADKELIPNEYENLPKSNSEVINS